MKSISDSTLIYTHADVQYAIKRISKGWDGSVICRASLLRSQETLYLIGQSFINFAMKNEESPIADYLYHEGRRLRIIAESVSHMFD